MAVNSTTHCHVSTCARPCAGSWSSASKQGHSAQQCLVTRSALALVVENVPSIPRSNALVGQLQKRREGSPRSAPSYILNSGQLCVTISISLDPRVAIDKQTSSREVFCWMKNEEKTCKSVRSRLHIACLPLSLCLWEFSVE